MVATGKATSDEPLYGRRCIVSTCNKSILQQGSSDKLCASCEKTAKNATIKSKARRLKPIKAETGLWTPQSEASSQKGSDSDTIRRRKRSSLPLMADSNDRGKKRKLVDADEIKLGQNPKSQKVDEVTEENSKANFTTQGSKTGTIGFQELNALELSIEANIVDISTYRDTRGTGISPMKSMATRSRSIINSGVAKSSRANATKLAIASSPNSSFMSILPDIQVSQSTRSFSDGHVPSLRPRNDAHNITRSSPPPSAAFSISGSLLLTPEGATYMSEGSLSESEVSYVPEDFFLQLEESPPLSEVCRSPLGVHLLSEGAISVPEGSPLPADFLSIPGDSLLELKRPQFTTDNVSTNSAERGPEDTYKGKSDEFTEPSSIMCKGSNMPSTPQSTSLANTTLNQPTKALIIPPNDLDFTDNGIVQFQSFVPFVALSPDSIEPTLHPDSIQARRSNNSPCAESSSLSFYDLLSKYRGSDEESMERTMFDLHTGDQSYISIQAKIAARGGRKRQFGEVCSRLDVDSTWSKHQNQPLKVNLAVLDRDDLPLQKVFGEFNANDMVPAVVDGKLYLTQNEEYEGPRRMWRFGDGGSGKDQGYPEAQAGAWARLAKASI